MIHTANTTEGGIAALEAKKAELIGAILDMTDADAALLLDLCGALRRLGDDGATGAWLRQTLRGLGDVGGPQ